MAKALELKGMSLQQINSNFTDLKASLENPDSQVQLNIANSLWADKNSILKPEFIKNNQDFYQAEVTNINFADANAPSIINNWVKQNTEGKIEKNCRSNSTRSSTVFS